MTGLRCPACKHLAVDDIVDSRLVAGGDYRWRRRRCNHCGRRWTTRERLALACAHPNVHLELTSSCLDCRAHLSTQTWP